MPFYLACVALPFYASTFMLDGIARSYDWINVALLPPYVMRPLLLIAGVAAARAAGISHRRHHGHGRAGAGDLVLRAVPTFHGRAAARHGGPARRARPSRRGVWLNTALPIVLVWGMYTLLTSTDVLVLKQFRPAAEVAHYYAAAKTLALISIIHFAVAAATAHRFTAYHVAGDRAGLDGFRRRHGALGVLAVARRLPADAALGRPVLSLFGAGLWRRPIR